MRLAAVFAFTSLLCALIFIHAQREPVDASSTAASLQLEGNGLTIAEGSYQTDTADGSDFGSALLRDGPTSREFHLHNPSSSNMYFGPFPGWQSEGPQSQEFQLAAPLPRLLAPGASIPFEVEFRPEALGIRTTMIRIPYRLEDALDLNQSLDFRVQGRGVGLGSLLVRAGHDNRQILSGDVVSNQLEGHWTSHLPSHVIIEPDGTLQIRLKNRARNSLLPIKGIHLSGPQAHKFRLSYPRGISQLKSSQELMIDVHFSPDHHRTGLYQAVLTVETGDAVVPQFEVLLVIYREPGSDG